MYLRSHLYRVSPKITQVFIEQEIEEVESELKLYMKVLLPNTYLPTSTATET